MLIDNADLVLVAFTFLLAGMVEGVVGWGLATTSLAVLTVTIGLQPAMVLLLAPSFAAHVWQAVASVHTWAILVRLWLFLLAAVPTIWLGVRFSYDLRMWVLIALLGIALMAYSITRLCRLRVSMSRRNAVWLGSLAGFLTGVCTGLTGAFEVLGAGYFQAVGLTRNPFGRAMALFGLVSTAGLALSLSEQRLLSTELGMVSTGAVAPAVMGMMFGKRLRNKRPAVHFRRLFDAALLVLGFCVLTESFR